jgi:hypothetical protein
MNEIVLIYHGSLVVALGGVVVSMLATGLNPAEDRGFLRAIKICSTTSFREEVKLSVLCRKILWHVEEP